MLKLKESFNKIKSKIDFKFFSIFLLLCGILFFELDRYFKVKNFYKKRYSVREKLLLKNNRNEKNFNRQRIKANKEEDFIYNVYNDKMFDIFNDPFFENENFFKEELNRIKELERRFDKIRKYEFEKFEKNFKKNKIKKIVFSDEEDFFHKKNNQYLLKIKIPTDIENNDIKINFDNNVLSLNISKYHKENEKDFNSQNYYSYSRIFTTPKTKADIKDIKKEIKNGILNIIIPIK